MQRVQFKDVLHFRRGLARSGKQFCHLGAHFIRVGGDDGRRIGQTMGQTNLFHPVAEQRFGTLNERLQRLLGFFSGFIHFVRQLIQRLIGFRHRLERLTVELGQIAHHPLVDAIGKQQHFNAFLTQQFQMRAAFRGGVAVGGNVVNLLLPFFHAGDVLFQRHGLRGGVGMGAGETQQFGDGLLVSLIFRRPLFQHEAKLLPEGLIFFRVVFRQFFQHLQGAFAQRGSQIAGDAAVLKDFTRHVQRQIVRVDQAADETQVVRHKLLGVIHDEDALHVQLQAVFMIAIPHIPRRLRRDIQQAGVLLLTFNAVVAPGQRIAVIVGNVLIKLVVFVVFDFRLIARPQRLGFVNFLPANDGFAVNVFALFNFHRQRDVIGVFADDRTHAPVVEEIVLAFAQVQRDLGTAIGFVNVGNGIFAFASGFPEDAVFGAVARRAGTDGNFIGNNKRRIEAHAELANQLAVFRLVRAHGLKERFGAGLGDGAEMVDDLIAIHTNAVIGDGQGAVVFIK